ncbi:MAG TPA: CHRD domain-containing protein, partial [Bryobacteraceae bacterium]|nr:CHRD domain-containing protein [Bryobacteraceae bacterium]
MKRCLVAGFVAMAIVWTLGAQTRDSFKTRLSPVPIDAQLAPSITGHGSVSAVLAGTKLTLSGTFEGMRSAATAASLHQSKMTGVRGVMIHELTVSKAASGEVSGAVELTQPEVEALRKGLLYVVIHSVGAPDGNLWGW